MDLILDGFTAALRLLGGLDANLVQIATLSLWISSTALLLALVTGVPAGVMLALYRFRGRKLALSLVNTGMGLPPVVVGLFVSILLWRSGPLGWMELMYTPAAMVIAQTIIAWPLIVGLTASAIEQLGPRLPLQLTGLGASRVQLAWTLIREVRLPILAAVIAGFGAVISEVGSVMMVGGNIPGQTRTLTTAVVQETRMGRFDMAIALSLILLSLAFLVNWGLTRLQHGRVIR